MHPPTYTLQAARLAEPRIKALGLEMGFAAIDATSPGTYLCVCLGPIAFRQSESNVVWHP